MRSRGEAKASKTELPWYGMVPLEFYMYEAGKPRAVYINLAYAWNIIFGPAKPYTMIKWLKRYQRIGGNYSEGLVNIFFFAKERNE